MKKRANVICIFIEWARRDLLLKKDFCLNKALRVISFKRARIRLLVPQNRAT